MKRVRWLRLILILAAIAIALYALLPSRKRLRSTLSFLPELHRMAGVRFDPSYFYGRGVTALELARDLVPRWREAGYNTVFFRAYDPAYGASYRTSLPSSKETDYGRQDLLRFVLGEAHRLGMKVYAWLPVLQHGGVWEAHAEWRVLRPDGQPYKTETLLHPLCPRHPGAREWWLRFVDDLLDRYPELDGIDLAEPIVSWRAGEACYCALCSAARPDGGKGPGASAERAAPLTEILVETFRRARARGKETLLTSVLPASAEGDPLPFLALRDEVGLDLVGVLESPDRPQALCVELMWQEWAAATGKKDVFHPGWAKKAAAEVRRRVAGRARVFAHLELTDFGEVVVTAQDLKASVVAALEGGAEGFDIYDASLLEKKHAWSALKNTTSARESQKVLILHTENGASDAWQLANFFSHFATEVTVKPEPSYQAGEAASYDVLSYMGTDDKSPVGEALLSDLDKASIPILWINFNIEKLLARTPRFGLSPLGNRRDTPFDSIRYKGVLFPRKEPFVNLIRVSDPAAVSVVAELASPAESAPYAIHARNLWYFADNALSYAMEGSSYVVLADLLHDVLGEDHAEKKLALVRLEDIHPLTPPADLLAAARALHRRGIPFLMSLVPFYAFPEKGEFASMSDQPEFLDALKEAIRLGGSIVLHGITHQRTGESTADYEFWDTVKGASPDDRADAKTRTRLLLGLEECIQSGMYPLLWETPHYAAPIADYRVVSQTFSAAVERRQSFDRIGSDQLVPYVVQKDRFGQLLLPENLGYVPLDDQRSEPILQAAGRTAVVRDATVGFFFHVFCDPGILEEIADGLLAQGFSFPDVRSLALSVTGPDFHWSTMEAPPPASPPGAGARLIDSSGTVVWKGPPQDVPRDLEPDLGIRVFLKAEPELETTASPAPRLAGEDGIALRPLQAGILASKDEEEEATGAFRMLATPCSKLDPEGQLVSIPPELTLIVATERAAGSLDPAARLRLRNHIDGGASLLLWGRTPLSQELGVRFGDQEREVAEILERDYDYVAKLPRPRRIAVPAFGGDVEILAEAKDGGIPLLAALSVGQGKVIYSALPPFEPDGGGPYPHLMSLIQNYCLLAPVCRSKRLEVYFDPGQRENVTVEDLVKLWARHGVRVVHAGAWHEYRDWTYEYDRLIELAHQNGIVVYAWLVFPLVSQKFWDENPRWREKNPEGEDVNIDWRNAVSLVDPACLEAVKKWLGSFLERFPFDGVNLAGLFFGAESPEKPETFSPFSDAARTDFQEKQGFDPREIWDEGSPHFWKQATQDLGTFLAWRKAWITRLHRELLGFLSGFTSAPRALVVSIPDGLADPKEAEFAGVDPAGILSLRKEFPFQVQIMDAGAARPSGNARVASLLRDYGPLVDPSSLALHINLGIETERGAGLTGMPLYSILAAAGQRPVAIYSEDTIPDADWPLLAPALAGSASLALGSDGAVSLKSPVPLRLSFETGKDLATYLDGKPWPAVGLGEILIPGGEHRVTFRREERGGETRIVDASCAILEASAVSRGMRFVYETSDPAAVVLSGAPVDVALDGTSIESGLPGGQRGWPIVLPPGKHEVVAVTQSLSVFLFRLGSITLSSGIVALGGISLIVVAGLFLWGKLAGRGHRIAGQGVTLAAGCRPQRSIEDPGAP